MEAPPEISAELEIVNALVANNEVRIPYVQAESFVDQIDKTREYVMGLLQKYGLETIHGKQVVGCGAVTEELGHHYWLRVSE